jgi:hypothetical protein
MSIGMMTTASSPSLVTDRQSPTNPRIGLSVSFSPPKSMKSKRLKRLIIAAAIISLILIQAYLETTLGFTPNH